MGQCVLCKDKEKTKTWGRTRLKLYNGHKWVHGIKFQSIVCPGGMIANLYVPIEGHHHGRLMLARLGILNQLEHFSFTLHGEMLCIYGDSAYPFRAHFQTPFRGANRTPLQISWNEEMSSARVPVEWVFGDIINYFKFRDFQKNVNIKLSPVGKMYIVCALLHNERRFFYGKSRKNYFGLHPPLIGEYFL